MPEMKVYLSEELDKRFRRIAMSTFGFGKGSLSKAATEAFLEWSRARETVPPIALQQMTETSVDEKQRNKLLQVRNEQEKVKPDSAACRSTIDPSTTS